jgi:hypothetical protein
MGAKARAIDPGFRTVPGAYDGQYNWGIAIDPLATGDVHQRFDDAPYRYGHPLYGWLGWLLSAGQARAVPAALLAAGLASMLAAGAAAAALGRRRGGSGWAPGLFVAVNPGLLYAAAHDLVEPLSAALLCGGLLAYANRRNRLAALAFALLALSKEQFVLVALGIAAWEFRRPRTAATIAASVVPAAAWWIYTRVHLGAWFTSGSYALGPPFSGWKRTILDAGAESYSKDYTQFLAAEATLVVVVALLALLAFAAVRALRLRDALDLVYLLLAALATSLAWGATFILRDSLRNAAVLLVLVPFVLRARGSAPAFARRAGRRAP